MDNSEQSQRIIALEQERSQVVANAAVIGKLAERIRQLETAVLEQHNRIAQLEAVLGVGLTAGEIARAQGTYTTAMPPAGREQ